MESPVLGKSFLLDLVLLNLQLIANISLKWLSFLWLLKVIVIYYAICHRFHKKYEVMSNQNIRINWITVH